MGIDASVHALIADWQESPATLPALALAVRSVQGVREPIVAQVTRLLGCGWTMQSLDTAITEAVTAAGGDVRGQGSGKDFAARTGRRAIDALFRLAHLAPDEIRQWVTAYDGDIRNLDSDEVVRQIDIWRAHVPGRFAPICVAAGLAPREAAAMYAAGALDDEALRTLAGLH